MDENKFKINAANRMKFSNSCIIVMRMIKIVEIWSCSCNILKSSCKRLQIACSRKWAGYILADFYYCFEYSSGHPISKVE
jgi:hypothetical protein